MNKQFHKHSNRILSQKWDQQNRTLHKNRIGAIKPIVSTYHSKMYLDHISNKAKKDVQAGERMTEIQRENKLLLNKMTNIMSLRRNPIRTLQKPGMSIIQKNVSRIHKGSLNRGARKKELIKITIENQALLRRIQDKQPVYQTNRYINSFQKRAPLIRNICRYPYQFDFSNEERRTIEEMDSQHSAMYKTNPGDLSKEYNNLPYSQSEVSLTSQDRQIHTAYANYANPLARRALNPDKKILCRHSRQLESGYYIIEISQFAGNMYILAAEAGSTQSMVVEIDYIKAEQLMKEFNNDYISLAEHLDIVDKKLVILNPNPKRKRNLTGSASQIIESGNKRKGATRNNKGMVASMDEKSGEDQHVHGRAKTQSQAKHPKQMGDNMGENIYKRGGGGAGRNIRDPAHKDKGHRNDPDQIPDKPIIIDS